MFFSMTVEWMRNTLTNLGFKQNEAEVITFLALNGSQKAKSIVEAVKIHKRQVYRLLEKLGDMGIVNASNNRPAYFYTISFDKLLDKLKDVNLEEAAYIEAEKDKIINFWDSNLKEKYNETQ
jgi:sugar-specific transcriptional regulator TrmB